jgi:alkanesulfonate monooxygenase SsuD/methylene tetrahydromethanopterin reductase-like flavin-dependent oxidoreductase (luciferase family)
MAARTQRIRLGTLLTPLPWRRPWKVASQVATVDQLSGGRAILAVGVGAVDTGLPDTGEETDKRLRAIRMDEEIDLIRTLWDGGLSYHGSYYQFDCAGDDLIRSVRPASGRIPIWVVGVWPRPKSMRRVLRCDGIVPQYNLDGRDAGPDDARAVHAWLADHGARPDTDIVAEGQTPADDPGAAAAQVTPWARAGCTWWIENRWVMPEGTTDPAAVVRDRLAAGPPAPAGG